MRIGKFSFVMIKDRGVMIVDKVKKRSVEEYELPDRIFEGYFINPKNISLEGASNKRHLNIKTCTIDEIDKFFENDNNYQNQNTEKSWAYIEEAQAIVNRDFFKKGGSYEIREAKIPEMITFECRQGKHFTDIIDFEVMAEKII